MLCLIAPLPTINSLSPGWLLPFIYLLRRKLSLTYPKIRTGAMAVIAGQLTYTKFTPSSPSKLVGINIP